MDIAKGLGATVSCGRHVPSERRLDHVEKSFVVSVKGVKETAEWCLERPRLMDLLDHVHEEPLADAEGVLPFEGRDFLQGCLLPHLHRRCDESHVG